MLFLWSLFDYSIIGLHAAILFIANHKPGAHTLVCGPKVIFYVLNAKNPGIKTKTKIPKKTIGYIKKSHPLVCQKGSALGWGALSLIKEAPFHKHLHPVQIKISINKETFFQWAPDAAHVCF